MTNCVNEDLRPTFGAIYYFHHTATMQYKFPQVLLAFLVFRAAISIMDQKYGDKLAYMFTLRS